MDSERIAIIGAGGHAREQLELVRALNASGHRLHLEGFVLDAEFGGPGDEVAGWPVLGDLEALAALGAEVGVVCGLGSSAVRAEMVGRVRRCCGEAVRFATLVHPAAFVGESVVLGEGVIVGAAAVVTADATIGEHAHLGVGSVVSHDGRVGAFASLAPGARLAGHVTIGEGAQIGIGAVVRDRITVGAWSQIGAGAAVVEDVPDRVTAIGVPARVVETGGAVDPEA